MATYHKGRFLHAGKRTADEMSYERNLMGNPEYTAGDPLLQEATITAGYPSAAEQAAALANIEHGEYKEPPNR